MESILPKKFLPWVIGGCSLLVVLACLLTVGLGMAGTQLFNQIVLANQAEYPAAAAQTTPNTAVLQDLQGWVEVQREGGGWSPAEAGQVVTAGQQIRTGKLSSAALLFHDGSQALLKAETELAIDALDAQQDGKPRTIVMTQNAGESSHTVIPNQHSASRYDVRTSSGAGEAKGTEFTVVVTPLQTAYYYVIEGVVAVSALETTVLVNPGYMTIISLDQPPLVPVQTIEVEGLLSQADSASQWTVAGTTFTKNDATAIVGSPQAGDWVAIKGHLDENNANIADWIILLRPSVTNRFSLTGTIEAIDADQWTVNGQVLFVGETTELDADLQVGDTVYVRGLVETGGGLQALKIERIAAELGLPFAFTGIVQEIDGSFWEISGTAITTDETTSLTVGLKAGDLVMVKGTIQSGGNWLAQKIELVSDEDNAFTFTGKLETKDPWRVAGISFETRADTIIQADLETDDLVRVEGVIDANGVWIATKIERVDAESGAKMVLIGTVISTDPWIVNGINLTLTADAEIRGEITAGMLVRVELVLQADGSLQVIKIEPVSSLVWFPGCMDVIATVVSVNGDQLQLLNWPMVTLGEGATIEGALAPNSVVRMRVCFDEVMLIKVTYILILEPGTVEPPAGEEGGKVTVCHKPDGKKGGHSITISRSALPAHLGHGDYEGGCR